MRLPVTLGISLLSSIIWIWLAALVLSPTYAVAIGIVAGIGTMLVIAATQMAGEEGEAAPSVGEAASASARESLAPLQNNGGRSAGGKANIVPSEREQ